MNTINLLKKLIQIKSFSGQENILADYIVDWAKDHELPVEKQNGNVVIKFLKHSSKAVIFNAHMDTVKPGSSWSVPPTGNGSGVVKDNKVYGLGASDDKAAIASFLTLATELKKSPPPIDIFIVFVTNEEISGVGSQSFVSYFQKKYGGKYKEVSAVLGEPTDLEYVEIGHRGSTFLKVTTGGDSGHGSKPENIEKHSIYENIKTVEKITALGAVLAQKYKDSVLGAPSFCLTGIQSESSSVNKVPSSCYSIWDIRTTPKLHTKVVSFIQGAVGQKVKIDYVGQPSPYSFTSPKSKIVGLFQEIVPNLKVKISPGSNDSCVFTQVGIPSVTFGPGRKAGIHKPDEFVEIDKVEKSVVIYKKLLEKY